MSRYLMWAAFVCFALVRMGSEVSAAAPLKPKDDSTDNKILGIDIITFIIITAVINGLLVIIICASCIYCCFCRPKDSDESVSEPESGHLAISRNESKQKWEKSQSLPIFSRRKDPGRGRDEESVERSTRSSESRGSTHIKRSAYSDKSEPKTPLPRAPRFKLPSKLLGIKPKGIPGNVKRRPFAADRELDRGRSRDVFRERDMDRDSNRDRDRERKRDRDNDRDRTRDLDRGRSRDRMRPRDMDRDWVRPPPSERFNRSRRGRRGRSPSPSDRPKANPFDVHHSDLDD